MKVYVARHAETNYNLRSIFNGDPSVNVYLTPKGIEQGKFLAESLKDIPIDLIITSQFPRTKETAKLVNEYHDAPFVEDKRIGDIVTGYENKSIKDYKALRDSDTDRWNFRLKDGESFEDVKTRVKSFIDDLRMRKEEHILIVTHQITAKLIYAIYKDLSNEEAEKLEISNVECFEVEL
jgi:broad specificity phosphatase PhoE